MNFLKSLTQLSISIVVVPKPWLKPDNQGALVELHRPVPGNRGTDVTRRKMRKKLTAYKFHNVSTYRPRPAHWNLDSHGWHKIVLSAASKNACLLTDNEVIESHEMSPDNCSCWKKLAQYRYQCKILRMCF